MLLIVVVIVLLVALGGGGWGYSRFGYAGLSPLAVVLIILAVLWATGNLHLR